MLYDRKKFINLVSESLSDEFKENDFDLDKKIKAHIEKELKIGRKGAGILFICPKTKRILLLLRSMDTDGEPGTWASVGGAIDPNEDPAKAAKREALEEIGYNYTGKLYMAYVWKHPNLRNSLKKTYYLPSYAQPIGKFYNFIGVVDKEFDCYLNWENDDYGWFFLDDLPYPLHSGIKKLLTHSKDLIQKLMSDDNDNKDITENINIEKRYPKLWHIYKLID